MPGPSSSAPGGSTSSSGTSAGLTGAAGMAGKAAGMVAKTGAQFAQLFNENTQVTITPGTPVAVQAGDFYFQPNALTVKAGTTVHLQVKNLSTEPHNFQVPAFNVNVTLPAQTTTAVTFTPTRAGTYYFACGLPGQADAGMVGRLTVT
jgi:uncharacterized cupredoxin-like copper-binding protein